LLPYDGDPVAVHCCEEPWVKSKVADFPNAGSGGQELDKGLQLVYVWANTNGVQSRKAAAEPDENLILGLEPKGGAMNKN
jgi:hypothetical protein